MHTHHTLFTIKEELLELQSLSIVGFSAFKPNIDELCNSNTFSLIVNNV